LKSTTSQGPSCRWVSAKTNNQPRMKADRRGSEHKNRQQRQAKLTTVTEVLSLCSSECLRVNPWLKYSPGAASGFLSPVIGSSIVLSMVSTFPDLSKVRPLNASPSRRSQLKSLRTSRTEQPPVRAVIDTFVSALTLASFLHTQITIPLFFIKVFYGVA
jgi:hypothetical protein